MQFSWPVPEDLLEWSAQLQKRSGTTGLIMEASHVLQATVGVLSKPERGAFMRALGTALRTLASCKKGAVRSGLELVILP